MLQGVFVTGTDTEVGKTYVSVALVRAMVRRGLRVAAMKPVASGARRTPDGLRNDDAEQLRAAAGTALPYEMVNPYCFEPPIAPHLAAAAVGERIDVPRIVATARSVAAGADWMLVEGVGGWRVPLADGHDVASLASRLGLPVLLVVGLRLGCINHALLTAAAIRADGLPLLGWIANGIDPDYATQADTLQTLQAAIGLPPLAVFEHAVTADRTADQAVQTLLCPKC